MRNQFPSPRGNRSQTSGYEPVKPEEESYIIMDADVEKKKIMVHLTFLKIGEINTLKEQFDAEILLRLKWREPALDRWTGTDESTIEWDKHWNPMIFINNRVGEPMIMTNKSVEKEKNKAYVIERRTFKGTFSETMELMEFPFDVQDLSISVICEYQAIDVQLVEDPEHIHKIFEGTFIDEQEWYLYKLIESDTYEIHKDQADPHDRRSVVYVSARVSRRPAYFIWNIFSVTFLICALSFVTFAVNEDLTQNRLQLTFTLVLTCVAFKFVVNQSLPRISYLTYLDRYILATMIVLFCTCVWHGIMNSIPEVHKSMADDIALVSFMVLYLMYNIQFALRIYLTPYKRRREMLRREVEYRKRVGAEASRRASQRRGKSQKIKKKEDHTMQEGSPKTEKAEVFQDYMHMDKSYQNFNRV